MGRPVELTLDPPTAPHICVMCKAHTQLREWFVDTGVETEWEGVVYICNECMIELVRVAPTFMSVKAHKEIVAEYRKELDEYADLKCCFELVEEAFIDLTDNSFWEFFNILGMIKNYGRLVSFPGPIPSSFADITQPLGDSEIPESDDSANTSNEPESSFTTIQFQ
jgi:hypothetical protein